MLINNMFLVETASIDSQSKPPRFEALTEHHWKKLKFSLQGSHPSPPLADFPKYKEMLQTSSPSWSPENSLRLCFILLTNTYVALLNSCQDWAKSTPKGDGL